jgi:hypothetical protein
MTHAVMADKVLWQNDFEKNEDLWSGCFGQPLTGFSCQWQVTDRQCGDGGNMTIIFKGLTAEEKFSGEKSLKLEISAKLGDFFYFHSKPLSEKIALKPNLYFSGYLYRGSEIDSKMLIKVCPRFETIRLKDNKKTFFEYMPGGYSPTDELEPQSAQNWYGFNVELLPEISKVCEKDKYSLKDTFFIGWSIKICGVLGEKPLKIYVDDLKLYEKEEKKQE